jgi:hypothetical protein
MLQKVFRRRDQQQTEDKQKRQELLLLDQTKHQVIDNVTKGMWRTISL